MTQGEPAVVHARVARAVAAAILLLQWKGPKVSPAEEEECVRVGADNVRVRARAFVRVRVRVRVCARACMRADDTCVCVCVQNRDQREEDVGEGREGVCV